MDASIVRGTFRATLFAGCRGSRTEEEEIFSAWQDVEV